MRLDRFFQGQSELFQQAFFLIHTAKKQFAWKGNLIALEDEIDSCSNFVLDRLLKAKLNNQYKQKIYLRFFIDNICPILWNL